ncbi:MAG: hypothetical protein ACO3SY_00320 [Flavobacteriaceae bacterium]
MKQLLRSIGFSLLGIGITLTLFEFFLQHSEWILGGGILLLVVSFFLKDQNLF